MHYKEYKSILSPKNIMNIYRGCTHGCIYCDGRSVCYQILHDFEDIEIKTNAPLQLEQELKQKRKLAMIGTGAMSDPYISEELEIMHTRECIKMIERYGFGLAIQTKSNRILRDLDLLKSINKKAKCVVMMTLTTYDEDLCKILEPNVCTTKERFNTLKILNEHGIPTVVWLSPILPFINDTKENLLGILGYCKEANVYGIINFGFGVTLREGDREYFYTSLDKYFPGMKEKYHKKYGYAYEVTSEHNNYLMKIFFDECKKCGIESNMDKIFRYTSTFPNKESQISLFDEM